MAASISAVAATCAKAPTSTQGQNVSPGRGSAAPVAMSRPTRKTSANGKPNRKRTCVAPTVPRVPVSSRCAALRTVCVNAAMTVKTAHSQDAAIACSAVRHRRPLRHHAAFSAAIM